MGQRVTQGGFYLRLVSAGLFGASSQFPPLINDQLTDCFSLRASTRGVCHALPGTAPSEEPASRLNSFL